MGDMDLDGAYACFKSQLTKAVHDCSSKRKKRGKTNLYADRTALQLRKKKRLLWSIYCRTQNVLDLARYKHCSNNLRRLTRILRKDYESKLAAGLKNNPKSFWRYSSTRLRTRCGLEDWRDENGTTVSVSQKKADILNKFFSSVFTVEGYDPIPSLECNFDGPLLEDVDVSPEKVEAKLAWLNPRSYPSPDSVRPSVLRNSARVLAYPSAFFSGNLWTEALYQENGRLEK